MNRNYKQIIKNERKYNLLALPNTDYFKFEIVNLMGSNIEKVYNKRYNKNVYGMSHLVEHLSFRSTKDYSSDELIKTLKSNGNYNASTDYDRINYWFKTTSENMKLGINLICNIAMNNLSNISPEEFDIEKKVVFNEAKRYADDDQTMFYFDSICKLHNYEDNDNIISSTELIQNFELEDCINIKDLFLQNDDIYYNISYNPEIISENDIIETIENELNRFKILKKCTKCTTKEYKKYINTPKNEKINIKNESEQSMHCILFDSVFNEITAEAANTFLLKYSETSLNSVIREKNGLTYGVSLYTMDSDENAYTVFSADVTDGDEAELNKLLKYCIDNTVKDFNCDKYEEYMKIRKLKRKLNLVNQENYEYWHYLATRHQNIFYRVKHIIEKNLDDGYTALDNLFCSYEKIEDQLKRTKYLLDNNKIGYCSNKKWN